MNDLIKLLKNGLTAWEDTQKAIEEMSVLNVVWSRPRTSWSLTNMTLTLNGRSAWRQMRQVAAELEGRRQAFHEAKWRVLRLQAEIEALKEKLAGPLTAAEQQIVRIDIGEREERIPFIMQKLEGATRDVRDLKNAYDRLLAETGPLTEEAVNAHERASHLERAIRQSFRDMRERGTITAGNQEYLEQCGVDPSFVQRELSANLAQGCCADADASGLNAFVDGLCLRISMRT